MERGARIIIHEWVRVKAWDKVLIVTSKEHQAEAKALEVQARKKARSVNTLIVENKGRHVGIFFDDNEAVFDPYTAIIAATEYSLVTTKAAKRAIQKHKKFLSLPLSTNDGRSLLEFDFLLMDTKKEPHVGKAVYEVSPFIRQSACDDTGRNGYDVLQREPQSGIFQRRIKRRKRLFVLKY